MPSPLSSPVTVALVDDYDVVVMGVANMFDRYRDRGHRCRTRLDDARR
jgi:two-component system, NarL family, response regulator LiaR